MNFQTEKHKEVKHLISNSKWQIEKKTPHNILLFRAEICETMILHADIIFQYERTT